MPSGRRVIDTRHTLHILRRPGIPIDHRPFENPSQRPSIHSSRKQTASLIAIRSPDKHPENFWVLNQFPTASSLERKYFLFISFIFFSISPINI